MSRNNPTTVGVLEKRLRRMIGHVGGRDKETLLEAIEAIHELSTRLYEAEHPDVGTDAEFQERQPKAKLEIIREPEPTRGGLDTQP